MKFTLTLVLASAAIALSIPAHSATPEAKAAYTAATNKADTDYKTAGEQCDTITGNPKDVCIAKAKAERIRAKAMANAQLEGTSDALTSAKKDIAEGNYDVAKTQCASQNGNAKDVCMKQAKANLVAANADAVAENKIVAAKSDASADKNSADYKVALEKCDALAGPGKDACVKNAKSQFNQ